jgi:hypothetical protein
MLRPADTVSDRIGAVGVMLGRRCRIDQPRRSRNRFGRTRVVAALVAPIVAAACTQGSSSQPPSTGTLPTSSLTTPSRAVPQSSTISASESAAADVEVAVRAYFAAFESLDFAGLESHSVGELTALAGWLRVLSKEFQGLGVLSPGGASIDSLTVVSIAGRTATVAIRGQLDETAFNQKTMNGTIISSDISGPVTLVRRTTAWQVADFRREGRSVRDQIYTTVRGQQTSQGITVKVIGVDLRPRGTVVVLEVRNTTLLNAGAANPIIIDTSGRQHQTGLGSNTVLLEVNRRSTTKHALFFPSGLPSGTARFRFRTDVDLGCNPVCRITTSFDIPVQLVR